MFKGVGQGEKSQVLQSVSAVGTSDEVAKRDSVGEGSCNSSLVDSNMLVKCIEQVLVLDVTSIVVDVPMVGEGLERYTLAYMPTYVVYRLSLRSTSGRGHESH